MECLLRFQDRILISLYTRKVTKDRRGRDDRMMETTLEVFLDLVSVRLAWKRQEILKRTMPGNLTLWILKGWKRYFVFWIIKLNLK